MIIGVDIETDRIEKNENVQKLEFIIGCIVTEKGKKEFFYKPKDMWNRILEIGYKENKRKKNLYVYAHNHDFDFQGYANKKDTNIEYFKLDKLIANYKFKELNNNNCIMFLDTMLIHNRSLKSMGEFINIPKIEWNFNQDDMKEKLEKIKKDIKNNLETEDVIKFKEYNENDAIIVVEFIKKVKEYLKQDGFKTRKLLTIGLISKNYFTKRLKIICPEIFENLERGKFKQFNNEIKEFIHVSYRAGRNEIFNIGEFENASELDINSSYPYSLINIEIPILDEYKHINETSKFYKKSEILKNIGVSKVVLEITKDLQTPLLPVRTTNGVCYPKKKGDIILSNYTHLELNKAIKEGYKIKYIMETIMFEKKFEKNPFKEIITEIFEKRKKDEFANYLYKNIMNNFVGKLAQRNKKRIIRFGEEYQRKELIKQGFKIIGDVEGDNKYIFEKKSKDWEYSGFYNPIIAAYVNANSRILLFDAIKKIDEKDRILCNTDSIVLLNVEKYINKFKIDNELGNWKLKKKNKITKIYSKNQYQIDGEIRVSGVHSGGLNLNDFTQGKLVFNNKIGLLENTNDGIKFVKLERDLVKSTDKEITKEEEQQFKKFYIEENIKPEEREVIEKLLGL